MTMTQKEIGQIRIDFEAWATTGDNLGMGIARGSSASNPDGYAYAIVDAWWKIWYAARSFQSVAQQPVLSNRIPIPGKSTHEKQPNPGKVDLIIGKTSTGNKYFDTGHDCVPWIECEYCMGILAGKK
jgi:hypothetical protein